VNVRPLRDALLAQARAEAERTLEAADRAAAARLDRAAAEGEELVRAAAAEGAETAAAAGAHAVVEARRTARRLVLETRHDLWEELHDTAAAQAGALVGTPAYARLVERLRAAAVEQLGPEARVEDAPAGGFVAARNGRRVDYSLPALVERALAELAPRAEELWS